MFTIRKSHTFKWPVSVRVPVDGGRHRVETLTVEFREIDQDRVNEILASGDNAVDATLLTEIVVGWEGVKDEDGEDVEFDAETLLLLTKVPYVRVAMSKAFMDAMAGIKTKN